MWDWTIGSNIIFRKKACRWEISIFKTILSDTSFMNWGFNFRNPVLIVMCPFTISQNMCENAYSVHIDERTEKLYETESLLTSKYLPNWSMKSCNFMETDKLLPWRMMSSGMWCNVALWEPMFRKNVASIIREKLSRELGTTLAIVRFEVFTAVTMKNGFFWDVTPCGSCKNRCFGGN
jgi:hypothetical protein